MRLVQEDVLASWEEVYASGSDKSYPSLELVRLERWFFGHCGNGTVLEYACGSGVNTLHLLNCGYDVVALDAAQGAIDLVTKKASGLEAEKQARLQLCLVGEQDEALKFEDSSFDYIVAMSILSLLGSENRIRHLLKEFSRVLRPGGKIILDLNDHASEFSADQIQIEPNVFAFEAGARKVNCFCLRSLQEFSDLIGDYFDVVDAGYSSHCLFGRRINEWIVSARKIE